MGTIENSLLQNKRKHVIPFHVKLLILSALIIGYIGLLILGIKQKLWKN